MKILYAYKEGSQPVYLDKTGVQRLLVAFEDSGDIFVYFCDDYLRHTYLNKVVNKSLSNIYLVDNFSRITSDDVFYHYLAFIEANYNYDGSHVQEKISGADQGGAVLVGVDGKPLL